MVFRTLMGFVNRFRGRLIPFEEAQAAYATWVAENACRHRDLSKADPKPLGFKFLNDGAKSAVYLSPCGRFVLKRNHHNGGDRGYGAFLEKVLERQENPYYPRVFAHATRGDQQLVLMERLTDLRSRGKQYRNLSRNIASQARGFMDMDDTEKADTAYVEIVQDLRELNRNEGMTLDMHDGNMMLRGEQLVVTDPLI